MKNDQSRKGKLHVIKTIQKNYRHDMVPFVGGHCARRPGWWYSATSAFR